MSKPKKNTVAHSNASYDTLCWLESNFQAIAEHMDSERPLSEFQFPNKECYTYAHLVVDGKDGRARLADFMKQKANIEKAEKRQRNSAAADDLRKNLRILKALRRHVPNHLRRSRAPNPADYSDSVLG